MLQKFLVGFVAGTMGSTLNIPFDVVKSRIQGGSPYLSAPSYGYRFHKYSPFMFKTVAKVELAVQNCTANSIDMSARTIASNS